MEKNLQNLTDLKDAIHLNVYKILPDMLRATAENAVKRSHLLLENVERHIQYALKQISETIKYI